MKVSAGATPLGSGPSDKTGQQKNVGGEKFSNYMRNRLDNYRAAGNGLPVECCRLSLLKSLIVKRANEKQNQIVGYIIKCFLLGVFLLKNKGYIRGFELIKHKPKPPTRPNRPQGGGPGIHSPKTTIM